METRVCKGPCGKELSINRFRREIKIKFNKSLQQSKSYISHRTKCKSCTNKLRTPTTIEKHIKSTRLFQQTSHYKSQHAVKSKSYAQSHKKTVNTYQQVYRRQHNRLNSYSYIEYLWKQRNLDISFTKEIWLIEAIRLQTVRAVRKAKKQFKLN